MAGNVKGITVELNGNTTNLTKSINDANKACNSISKELKTVDRLLKLDPSNVTLLTQKQDLLGKSIEITKQKLQELEASQDQVKAKYEAEEIDAGQYRNFQRDLIQTREALKSLEQQQGSVTDEIEQTSEAFKSLEQQKSGVKSIGDAFTTVKEKIGAARNELEPFVSGVKKVGEASATVFKVGATAVAAYAGAILAAGVATVGYASDLNEVQNVVDTTFGDAAGKIGEFAADAASSFGLSELQAKQFTGTMGSVLKSTGITGTALEEMSTKVAGLAGDFASFYNMESEEAFEKIRSGLSGETEPLKALGINMSEANLSAFALSEGITKSYKSLSEAEKVQLRYNYLLSTTKDAQGDFAKTSDSFANQQRIASLQLQTLSGAIGNVFLPIFTGAMQQVTGTLPQVSQAFTAAFSGDGEAAAALSSGVSAMLNGLITSISANLPGLLAGFNGVVLGLVNGLATSLPTLIQTLIPALLTGLIGLVQGFVGLIPTVLPTLIEGAMTLFTGIITGLTEIIPQIIEMLPELVTQVCNTLAENIPLLLDAVLQIIIAVAGAIIINFPQILSSVINGLGNVLGEIVGWGAGLLANIGTWLGGIITSIGTFFSNTFNNIASGLANAWNTVSSWFGNLIGEVGAWLGGIITSIAEFVSDMIGKAGEAAQGFFDNIVEGLESLPGEMLNIGSNIVGGIWDGISSGWNWLVEQVTGLANKLLDGVKGALGIHSPSTRFADEVGVNSALGVGVGFVKTMSKVRKDMIAAIPTDFSSNVAVNTNAAYQKADSNLRAAGIIVNVTNNSPKAISAAESARQTRNALRTFVLQNGGAL